MGKLIGGIYAQQSFT